MTIEEIIALAKSNNSGIAIGELKNNRQIPQPDTKHAQKVLNPELHDINDIFLRPDKRVAVTDDTQGESAQKVVDVTQGGEKTNYRTEKVARVALGLQGLIINRSVSFCFGNPIAYNCTPTNDNQQIILKALNKVLYHAKSNALNRKIGHSIFGFKECAEYWYSVEGEHSKYGFKAKHKLRCMVMSPEYGDTLYPFFDATGDMVAFSREFSRKDNQDNAITYFETFTNAEHWLWVNGQNGFEVVEGYPKPVAIGKIPIVYGYQPKFETQDVDKLVDRLETLLSNFADTNDYHASPKIFVTGTINGWSKKGESGAVIEGEAGSTMQYVSWQNAPESVKLEIETLLKMVYTITQTPDISFDSVKGLGAISGVALKLLFMDAHLKVQDKREIFDDYLQRRVNILLAYIGMLNQSLQTECENIEIEPEIVPYMITSDIDDLNYWLTANGNKPVISQEESIEKAGITKNVEHTMKKIEEESAKDNSFMIGEPVLDA